MTQTDERESDFYRKAPMSKQEKLELIRKMKDRLQAEKENETQ
jgi:hypothetical protein